MPVEQSPTRPLDYAEAGIMIPANRIAVAALGVVLLATLLVAALAPVSSGAWYRWYAAAGWAREETVYYVTLAASGVGGVLAIIALARVHLRNARRSATAATALVLALVNPILAISADFAPRRHRHDNMVRCRYHLTMIYGHLNMEATTNGGRLPGDLGIMFEYGLDEKLICPACGDDPILTGPGRPTTLALAAKSSYVYRGCGFTLATVTPKVILAHDKPGNHDRGGYDPFVLYGDGSIRTVPKTELKRLITELDAGFNPPRLGKR
jgi:hypothetical protein